MNWTRRELLPQLAPFAFDIKELNGVLLLATPDPAEFFRSTDRGATWEAVDTGFGWLAPSASGREEEIDALAVHNRHFVVLGNSGSLLYSPDGVRWAFTEAPLAGFDRLSLVSYKGALYAEDEALRRSGQVRAAPVIEVSGLDEGSLVCAEDLFPIEIEVTGMLPGERLEVRHNSVLLAETLEPMLSLPWQVGPEGRQSSALRSSTPTDSKPVASSATTPMRTPLAEACRLP